MGIWYVTRETVAGALDIKETARNAAQIDRCIESGARRADGLLRRDFAPWTGTLRFPAPHGTILWFGRRSLVRLDAVTVDDIAQDVDDFVLRPVDDGPPYDGMYADVNTSSTLAGATGRPSVGVTGLWGWDLVETSAGATAETLDASETAVDLTGPASAAVGVGSVLRVDDERMVVTGRAQLTTGTTLAADVGSGKADTSVTVSSAAGYAIGETILVGAEKMQVLDIAGAVLLVRRAVEGTVLAAHTSGTTVYAPRTVTVTRGALGTTAATHADAATVNVWVPSPFLAELNLAYALTALGQEQAGYARTVGSNENEREAAGRGLRQIEDDAMRTFKRWMVGAV